MRYFSTFSGIGGFELGITQAYENFCKDSKMGSKRNNIQGGRNCPNNFSRRRRLLQPTCIGCSEIDKYAIQVYEKHFPKHKNYGDCTEINTDTLPDFDLLVGGFPCQAFSVAGKRGGFNDTRGTLFFEIARILRNKRPRYFLLENVKGLLSHDSGQTFQTILKVLTDLGYELEWQVLNSKDFGVPQNRERVFIIGHLRGTCRPKVFPFGEDDGEDKGQITSTAIDSNYFKGVDNHGQRTLIAQRIPLKYLNRNQKNIEGDYSYTVDSMNTGGVMKDSKIRRLTPVECERLQGFPDHWSEGVSETQRYKCLGNAVTVNVIQSIMEKIIIT